MCICHNVECNCVDLVTCMCIYPWIYVYIYHIICRLASWEPGPSNIRNTFGFPIIPFKRNHIAMDLANPKWMVGTIGQCICRGSAPSIGFWEHLSTTKNGCVFL